MNWHDYFMNIAHTVATKSKDTTKVGCVIVGEDNQILSTGWNGFARGVDDNVQSRHERPEKYEWTIHAEANAICNAARSGVRLKGSIAYITHKPCSSCADMLIQSGIICVFADGGKTVGYTDNSVSETKLKEARVTLNNV